MNNETRLKIALRKTLSRIDNWHHVYQHYGEGAVETDDAFDEVKSAVDTGLEVLKFVEDNPSDESSDTDKSDQ